MTDTEQAPAPRPTPTQAYRELAMAYATKQPRHGDEEIELGQAATGDLKGQLYVKSLKLVRGESEDWPQFLGRIEQTAEQVAETLTRHNADKLRRDLEASVTPIASRKAKP